MSAAVDDRARAAAYLLGDLAEPEQVQVEERSFQDAAFSDLLSEVEDDLVDDYVAGALPEQTRRSFEGHYLCSPRRQAKVAFAASFQRAASARRAVPPPSARGLSRAWAVAAAIILSVAGSWLALEVMRLRREVSQLRAQGRAPESPLASTPAVPEPPVSSAAPVRAAMPVLASFALAAGIRGSADPATLVLPRGEGLVRLQLSPDAGDDDYPRYRAELRTAGGRPVWSEDGIVARRSGGETVVFADVPSRLLAAGVYEMALEGVQGTRRDALGGYPFKVAQP
jgi:hypothetical protein